MVVWGCSMICSYVLSIEGCCVTMCWMGLCMWLGLKFRGFVIAKSFENFVRLKIMDDYLTNGVP